MALPANLLNQSAVIGRSVGQVRDGRGGFRDATPTLVATVSVRIQPAGINERQHADALGAQVSHSLYALPGTPPADIRRGDWLSIGERKYHVVAVTHPSVPDFYVKALVNEVQKSGKPS